MSAAFKPQEAVPVCPVSGLTDAFYVYVVKDRLDKTAKWLHRFFFPFWREFIFRSYNWGMPFPKRVIKKGTISAASADRVAELVIDRLVENGFIHTFAAKDAYQATREVVRANSSTGVEWLEGLRIAIDEESARDICSEGPRRFYDILPLGFTLPNDTCYYRCASQPTNGKSQRGKVLPRVDAISQSDYLKLQELQTILSKSA